MKLYLNVNDNGDGSVSVDFHETKAQAETAQQEQEKEDSGFAESTVDFVELQVNEKGHIEFKKYNEQTHKFEWVELPLS